MSSGNFGFQNLIGRISLNQFKGYYSHVVSGLDMEVLASPWDVRLHVFEGSSSFDYAPQELSQELWDKADGFSFRFERPHAIIKLSHAVTEPKRVLFEYDGLTQSEHQVVLGLKTCKGLTQRLIQSSLRPSYSSAY